MTYASSVAERAILAVDRFLNGAMRPMRRAAFK
jgi:hypothetical protein